MGLGLLMGENMYEQLDKEYIDKMTPIWEEEKQIELAQWEAMRNELKGVEKLINDGASTHYRLARKLLYTALLPLEKELGSETEIEVDQVAVRKAGELLYEQGGMAGLYDGLVWIFIPNRVHCLINAFWDGIGEWQA